MKNGIRGAVTSRTRAGEPVQGEHRHQDRRRDQGREGPGREEAGIVGLQVLDPLDQGLHQGPATLPAT